MRKSHSTASSLSEIAKLKISSSNTSSNINNVIIPVNSINNLHENELKTLSSNSHNNLRSNTNNEIEANNNGCGMNHRGHIDNSNHNRFHQNVSGKIVRQINFIEHLKVEIQKLLFV